MKTSTLVELDESSLEQDLTCSINIFIYILSIDSVLDTVLRPNRLSESV